jgi:hypothetical protein
VHSLTDGPRARLRQPVVGACLAAGLLWAGAIAATPYLVSHGPAGPIVGRTAGLVYVAGRLICHQRPERSYHPWGVQAPVCARCEGIYLALPFGDVMFWGAARRAAASRPGGAGGTLSRAAWRRLVLLAGVPTLATLVWEWTTGDMTPGLVRAAAGVALGAPIAALVTAVVAGDVVD